MVLQISFLSVALLISLWFLRRAVPVALSNPLGFPDVRWRLPESLFTASLVFFFLAMAAASMRHAPGKIDIVSIGSNLVLYVALALMVLGFLIFRGFDIRRGFGLDVRGWNFALVASWLAMLLPLVYFTQFLAYFAAGQQQPPQEIVDFLLKNTGWQARVAVGAIAVVAAPITEELIFRGCLYGMLRQFFGRLPAIAVSAIIFALIHGHLPALPGLLVLAAGLALVYERCGSLWAPISMHAGFNALTILTAVVWPDLAK